MEQSESTVDLRQYFGQKSRKIMLLSLVPHPPFAGTLGNQSRRVFFFDYTSPLYVFKDCSARFPYILIGM